MSNEILNKPMNKLCTFLGFKYSSDIEILEEPKEVEEGYSYSIKILATHIYWLNIKIKTIYKPKNN